MIMRIWQDLETQAADRMMNARIVVRQCFRVEDMISIQSIREVVFGKIRAVPVISLQGLQAYFNGTYPEIMISSSTPYSFMCCKPQPSLIRLGIHFFFRPVKFGVWNIRISTRSAPYSDTSEHSNEAQDGFGVSRVPRSASVRIDTLRSGLSRRAWDIVSISSCSVLPMYNVER